MLNELRKELVRSGKSKYQKAKIYTGFGSPADNLVMRAIRVSDQNIGRTWSLPPKIEAASAVLTGVGEVLSSSVNTALGNAPTIKELVPMSSERWARWITAVMGGGYIGAIPGLNVIGGPIMKVAESLFSGSSKGGAARQGMQSAGAGALDSVIDAATLGGYAIGQLSTAWLAGVGAVYSRAHDFKENYQVYAVTIQGKIVSLESAYSQNSRNLSPYTVKKYTEQMVWMQRQVDNCQKRGSTYVEISKEYERKFDAKLAKVKAKLGIS